MRKYFKYLLYLLVVLVLSTARAGSYDDFFQAIREDNGEVVQSLLRRGFDPNTPSPDGVHGLLLAMRVPAPKVAAVLIAWPKTNVEPRTPQDESPLMLAALKGQIDLVKQLVARDADINKPGWAPLHYAATGGHVQIMEFLLEHSAFIDAESPNGTTPLMMAAMYGSPQAVKLLLDAGADTAMKNQLGLTALEFARRGSRPDAVKLLEARLRDPKPTGPLGPEAAAAALRAQGKPLSTEPAASAGPTSSAGVTPPDAATADPKAAELQPEPRGPEASPRAPAAAPSEPKRPAASW